MEEENLAYYGIGTVDEILIILMQIFTIAFNGDVKISYFNVLLWKYIKYITI